MTDKTPAESTRREFFKTAGLGSAAAAAVATGITPAAPAAASEAKPEAQGYRETAHVKRYYELAKF
jgi:nitrous oxide reductase